MPLPTNTRMRSWIIRRTGFSPRSRRCAARSKHVRSTKASPTTGRCRRSRSTPHARLFHGMGKRGEMSAEVPVSFVRAVPGDSNGSCQRSDLVRDAVRHLQGAGERPASGGFHHSQRSSPALHEGGCADDEVDGGRNHHRCLGAAARDDRPDLPNLQKARIRRCDVLCPAGVHRIAVRAIARSTSSRLGPPPCPLRLCCETFSDHETHVNRAGGNDPLERAYVGETHAYVCGRLRRPSEARRRNRGVRVAGSAISSSTRRIADQRSVRRARGTACCS